MTNEQYKRFEEEMLEGGIDPDYWCDYEEQWELDNGIL